MKKMEQDELLTIQEFAKKAGVSVQAVYKRLNNSLNPYIQLVEGRKMLKSSALFEIYGIEVVQPIQPSIQPIQPSIQPIQPSIQPGSEEKTVTPEVIFLRKQVEQLQAELLAERQHSRELAEKIVVLADQSQKLQLAQMSQQLMDGSDGTTGTAKPERSKSWWSRIFRKHRLTK